MQRIGLMCQVEYVTSLLGDLQASRNLKRRKWGLRCCVTLKYPVIASCCLWLWRCHFIICAITPMPLAAHSRIPSTVAAQRTGRRPVPEALTGVLALITAGTAPAQPITTALLEHSPAHINPASATIAMSYIQCSASLSLNR